MKKIINWFKDKFHIKINVPVLPEDYIKKKYNYFETRDIYERTTGSKRDELNTSYMLYREYDGGIEISERRFIKYLTETMIDYRKELKVVYPLIDQEYFEWIKNGRERNL